MIMKPRIPITQLYFLQCSQRVLRFTYASLDGKCLGQTPMVHRVAEWQFIGVLEAALRRVVTILSLVCRAS